MKRLQLEDEARFIRAMGEVLLAFGFDTDPNIVPGTVLDELAVIEGMHIWQLY